MYMQYILLAVYLAAVNVYAFMLVRSQKKAAQERGDGNKKEGNAKLFVAGFLGGAISAYAAMFILKFKTDSLLPMIVLPILAAINIYLVVLLLQSGILVIR